MTIAAIKPMEEPQLELLPDVLLAREFGFTGAVLEIAHELELQDQPQRLSRLLTDAAEVGATILRNGQNIALVESVALEVDRLIETTTSETEKLPRAAAEELGKYLTQLGELLAGFVGPEKARAFQSEVKTLVGEATAGELRKQVSDLLDDSGAIGSQVRSFTTANTDLLTRVNTLLDKIEQKFQLDDARERSAHKGRPFEELVQAELESIHGPLGDSVQCVRSDYGLLPKTSKGAKAGDFTVTINPATTRGREVVYVVEAKTGPLRAAEARRELETAIKNRGATAGVLVFDGLEDAPLGGRAFLPHGDGRFTAVLDADEGVSLAFEVACREARLTAIASVRAEGELDKGWLLGECNRLCEIVEEAGAMLRSVSTVERGAGEIRERYTQMRREALALIDDMRERAEE